MNRFMLIGQPTLIGMLLGVWFGGVGLALSPNQISDKLHVEPTSTAKQTAPSLEELERSVYVQINEYRQQQGLAPLTLNPQITQQARAHSQAMAQQGSLSHDGFEQRVRVLARSVSYRSAAENVAYNQGYNNPSSQAVRGWINSQGHRQNIQGRYNLTGIGVARNSEGEYFFTQIFISTR